MEKIDNKLIVNQLTHEISHYLENKDLSHEEKIKLIIQQEGVIEIYNFLKQTIYKDIKLCINKYIDECIDKIKVDFKP